MFELVMAAALAVPVAELEAIARDAHGRVGLAAEIVETGERVELRGAEPFPMQSVYKFPIAMAVLADVDRGRLRLDAPVRVEKSDFVTPRQHSPIRDQHPAGGFDMRLDELLRYAVSESDGSASDVLLRLAGGPGGVRAYLHALGIDRIRVMDTEKAIGSGHGVQYRNSATPREAVRLLKAFQQGRGLSPASRTLLMKWMTETPTGVRRLKGRLPESVAVAHKTGSSGTRDGSTAATNDIGLITLPDGRHLAIAVFVADSAAPDDTREDTIARLARAVYDAARR
jgi:beta-lactamase class A